MDPDTADVTTAQNEVMIALLARLTFGADGIKELVTEKKGAGAAAYISAYNALDGEIGVVDIAKRVKLDKSNLSKVLRRWAAAGIIYDVAHGSKPAYKNVLAITGG